MDLSQQADHRPSVMHDMLHSSLQLWEIVPPIFS